MKINLTFINKKDVVPSIIFTIIFLFLQQFIWCQENFKDLPTIPESDGPFEIKIGYSIINITDINEKEETIDFDGAVFLRWKDKRLAYNDTDSLLTKIDYNKTPEVLFQGDFKVKEMYDGWRPHYFIPNGVGDKNSNKQSIVVWPDGTVQYTELFKVKVETPMDMRLYPFDKQELHVFFHPFPYSRDELIFIPDNSLSRTWEQNMGLADWERVGEKMQERLTVLQLHDGSKKTISEFMISLKVNRKPMHVLFSIIFPMVLLVSLTWIVFWLDKQSVVDRINILFIGILSVVAYYFVIQDTVPEVSYFTLIDVFVIFTFLIMAASVIVTLIIGKLDQAGKKSVGDKLDRVCRWAFPASYAILTLIVYAFFAYFV